ncbi:MAG: MerR family transcriptional regulator [Planctomycetota bacterium]
MGAIDPKLLRIGEFARLAGTNLRTLRYYEELGLFTPFRRSQGGFRYYRETDLNRLKLIRAFQDLGLALEEIRELFTTREEGISRVELMRRVDRALASQDELLVQRVAAIEKQRDRIREARGKLEQCVPCAHVPGVENNFCEPCQADGSSLPEQLSALF